MKLLKAEVWGDSLYKDSLFSVDLYAADRIVAGKGDSAPYGVTKVGSEGNIYTQNVVGFSGVNASGKTTSINLLEFLADFFAVSNVMRSDRFSVDEPPAKLARRFGLRVIFWHEDAFYALDAELERNDEGIRNWYRIEDEFLYEFVGKRPSKKILASFDEFLQNARLMMHRGAMEGEPGSLTKEQKTFLREDTSIVFALTGNRRVMAWRTGGGLSRRTYDTPVVNAFDNSIEYLRWDESSEVYRLKFHDDEERSVSRGAAEGQLSTGTLLGSDLVLNSIGVLRDGGLMIVDELESGLNKSLVKTVIELFLSASTNPNGAQLIFTTHYPEILDFLPRKDDVYLLVRDAMHATSIIKYSDRVSRIENKKSEVVLSNYIKGTVPNYPDIRDLRSYVRQSVRGSVDE